MSAVADPVPKFDASEIPPFPVKRWTVGEYHDLVNAGVLADIRVELLEGWIVEKMTTNPLHDAMVTQVLDILYPLLDDGYFVRVQQSLTTDSSVPEPDLSIVRGDKIQFYTRHPMGKEVVLAVEISDSSLPRDRRKADVYGQAAIGEYWIINLRDHQVEVYREPGLQGYRLHKVLKRHESLEFCVHDVQHEIPVADLLPPLDLRQ